MSSLRRGPVLTARLCILLAALVTSACSDSPRRPNVVIIALDTLRPDHLGCYGSKRDTSPNIDAWSKDAVVFENAQSAAPWTAPSLISLMTSLYPSVHGVANFGEPGAMNERVVTLAEVLQEAGYTTAAFTDGGYAKPQFGLGQGFDIFPLNEGDLPHEHASNLKHPSRLVPNIDRTLRFLDEYADEPFFLFFHTYEVHGPYIPPPEDVKFFRPDYDEAAEHKEQERVLAQWNERREIDAEGVRLLMRHLEHCGGVHALDLESKQALTEKVKALGVDSVEPERMQFWRDLYDAEIRHTDRELKRLLDRLDRADLRDDTIVLFVSDHGEAFGERGTIGHGNTLHEEGLRVLLMLRARDIAPRRVTDVVHSLDVMPTLLDLTGVERSHLALQGRSLLPLLRGEPFHVTPVFSHALSKNQHEGRLWSVREGQWRFIWDDEQSLGKLFDLANDPAELTDVSATHPKIADRMLGLLRSQRDLDASFRDRASGPPTEYVPDDRTLEELKHLGYVDQDSLPSGLKPTGLPIPKLAQ